MIENVLFQRVGDVDSCVSSFFHKLRRKSDMEGERYRIVALRYGLAFRLFQANRLGLT
jgi:hypothetical protein